jgi:hypothetical protein
MTRQPMRSLSDPPPMSEVDRMRLTTKAVPWLQGLMIAPAGLLFLEPLVPGGPSGLVFILVLLLLVLPLAYLAGRYYERTIGRMRPRVTLSGIVLFPVICATFVLVNYLSRRWAGDGGVLLVAWMASLLAFWPRGVPRGHYAVMAVLFWVVGVLSALAGTPPREVHVMGGSFGALLFIGGGLVDHLILMRRLKPLPEEVDEPAL